MCWPQPAATWRVVRLGVAIALGFATGGGLASLAAAQSPAHVRSDHWVYEALYDLAARGLAPLWAASTRPLSRLELAGMVRNVIEYARKDPGRLSPGARETIERLASEFKDELAGLAVPASRSWILRAVAGPPGRDAPYASRDGGIGAGIAVPITPASAITLEGMRRFGAGTGWDLDRAFLSGWREPISVQVGRDTLWWGPGARGAFLLSDNAGPLDFARATYTRGPLRYAKVVASLGDGRMLYGTRVDALVGSSLRLGLSETIVGGGSFYLPYVLNPIPIVANYGLSLWDRARRQGENDNYLFAIDADWLVRPGVLAYGEVAFDDIDFDGLFPNRLGGTAGVYVADPLRNGRTSLRLEYAAVTNWVYATPGGRNNYVLRGRAVGHWMAPDGELISATVTHHLSPGASVQLVVEHLRKGEGQLGGVWTDRGDAWARLFLSGVVEITHAWQIRYRWTPGPQAWQAVSLSWSRVTNAGHQAGQTREHVLVWWDARFGF
jgi:hypothetical protein